MAIAAQSIDKKKFESELRQYVSVLWYVMTPLKLLIPRLITGLKPSRRWKALALVRSYHALTHSDREYRTHDQRFATWKRKSAEALAAKVGYVPDEHGFRDRGDHFKVMGLDFIPPWLAQKAPWCATGSTGVGLVRVLRHRVYAKSSRWYPADVATVYLVGQNESGTYFGHSVPNRITSVQAALDWIWDGHANDIIQRQGDVALIRSARGKSLPALPDRHDVQGDFIVHPTHPPLPLPVKGQRVIVGRRALARADTATRD